ncbi:BPG-independent [Mycena vulgaris]|nr:BPG-independent [Mycena vulgaris]
MPAPAKTKVRLLVHDGGGILTEPGLEGNAIEAGTTTNMDRIGKKHTQHRLEAHGTAVGLWVILKSGGDTLRHLIIGAGRVVWQDIVRLDVAITTRAFHKNPTILESFKRAKEGNGRLHLLWLIPDGGVHSHIPLLEAAKEQGVPHTYVHLFGDGRDTAPRSAAGYCGDLLAFMEKEEYATVVGRYYAMDRDKRWERIKISQALGEGKGVIDEIKDNYEKEITDEFLKPIIVNGDAGRIEDGDTIFLQLLLGSHARTWERAGSAQPSDGSQRPERSGEAPIHFLFWISNPAFLLTLSLRRKRYHDNIALQRVPPPQAIINVLAEIIATHEIKQAHIAETEKYAQVTFFLDGGVEKQLTLHGSFAQSRDVRPEARERAGRGGQGRRRCKGYDFVMCNFAPPDMVGHTGNFDAAVSAITHTGAAVGTVYAPCQAAGYFLLVTTDHGNAEQIRNAERGAPYTTHTAGYALVPEEKQAEEGEEGAICYVAPAILDLLMSLASLSYDEQR